MTAADILRDSWATLVRVDHLMGRCREAGLMERYEELAARRSLFQAAADRLVAQLGGASFVADYSRERH